MAKKKTTLKDIAWTLGISPSAVSKALSNHPRISAETKEQVLRVAKELNYQPSYLASALKKGKTNLVGVIMPRNNNSFFSSVLQNIEEVLNAKGYNVIITQSYESYEKECKNIEDLLHIQVDGIIASMANETVDTSFYKNIISSGVPLVLFDRGSDELETDFVGIDDYNSSHLVVDHLVENGCRRIAHFGGFQHTSIYKERIDGYKDALIKHGLVVDDQFVSESKLRIEDGRLIMKKLLKLNPRPDAVYAAGDFAALGALQVLKESNIKVPEEIAVVGFSNESFTSMTSPTISTVNQNSELIGRKAAEVFLKIIENSDHKETLENVILKPELIVRESSEKKG